MAMLKLRSINRKVVRLINKLDKSKNKNSTISYASNLDISTNKEEMLKNIRLYDFSTFYGTYQKPGYTYRIIYFLYTEIVKIIYGISQKLKSIFNLTKHE